MVEKALRQGGDTVIRRRLYNPAQLTPDELKASFVAREDTLAEMLRLLAEQTPGRPCQHMMLIGPRGMGKTTLGLRFLHAVSETPDLATAWQPVPFYEESYEIVDLADFWVAALGHLTRATDEPEWANRANALTREERDGERLAAYAIAALIDYYQRTRKRLILFVENLDGIFDQVRNEREIHALRANLIERPEILLLGSANTVFEAIRGHDQPFYEFFRLFFLRGITPEETGRLLDMFAGREDRPDIAQVLIHEHGRLETMRRLTDGNPRLLVLTCRILIEMPLGEAIEDLEQLIDEQTPYFKARIEELAPQARKVFHCLADGWKPMLAKEVADAAKLTSSHASAQIRQLVDRGYAREVKLPRDKRTRYEVGDRFYNIYFLLRFSRSNRQRLERLVAFLHEFFGTSGMRPMYSAILETLRTNGPHAENLSDWLEVAAGYVASDQHFPGRDDWRSNAVELANSLLGPDAPVVEKIQEAFTSEPQSTQLQAGQLLTRSIALIAAQHLSDASEVFRQTADTQPESLFARLMLGVSLILSERFEDSNIELERFLNRFRPDGSPSSRILAGIASATRCSALFQLKRIDDAIEELARMTESIDPDAPGFLRSMAANVCGVIGASLVTSNRLEDAISTSYRMTGYVRPDDPAEMRGTVAGLLRVAGDWFWKTERSETAFSAWQRVAEYVHVDDSVKLRKVAVHALAKKGYSQFPKRFARDATLDRFRDSIATWVQMAEYVHPEDPEDLRYLVSSLLAISGDVLSAYGSFGEAESACTKAMDLDSTHEGSWRVQAEVIVRRGDDTRLDQAEEYARRAVGLAPEKPPALRTLSNVLVRRGKTKESLDCLERLLRIDGNNPHLSEMPGLTYSLIRGVAAGHAKRVRRMMEESGLAESMEPLWHAVRAELGEELEPLPAEIMDTVREIRQEFAQNRT